MKNICDIKWVEMIDSTNTELHREMENLDNLSVLAAGFQTAGRGQRGNKWLSQAWQNLTFSILLKWEEGKIKASEQFFISKIATLAISSYLENKGIACRIKWPNDIYIRNEKICGMLIENSLTGPWITRSIIGIGLNINQTDFDPQLLNPTSMKKYLHQDLDVRVELPIVMDYFCHFLSSWTELGSSSLDKMYLEKLYRRNESHSYRDLKNNQVFNAIIKDVTDEGRLVVEKEGGKIQTYAFKEIGYLL